MDHQQMATAVRARSKAKSGNQKGKRQQTNKRASRAHLISKQNHNSPFFRNRTTFTDEQIHILQVCDFKTKFCLIAAPQGKQANLSDKKFRLNMKLFLCRRISSLTAILTVKILRGTVPLLFRIFAIILKSFF